MLTRTLALVLASALALSTVVGCAAPADEESASADGAVSSAERTAIMNALRATVKPQVKGQDVVFNVSNGHFASSGGYAFLYGKMELRSGGAVDYRGTEFQQYIDEGWFDDNISALLKKVGGRWTVVTEAIGSTDVPWTEWAEQYGAPPSIFPGSGEATEQQQETAGLADRRAVMDALRGVLKPTMKNQDIVFNVSNGAYSASGDFVFMRGVIRLRDGREVDYTGTEYQQYIDDGIFDDGFAALLKKESGAWVVKEQVVGPTDVPWMEWPAAHGAPESIVR